MSKKTTKRIGITFVVAAVMVVVIFATIKLVEYAEKQKVAEQAEAERQAVIESYLRVNFAFGFITADVTDSDTRARVGVYTPIKTPIVYNRFGVEWFIYIPLKYYEKTTGIVLEYDTVVDYLSQEFEPDGSLRLYNNGRHPEIEAFVDWMWLRWDEQVGMHLSDMELKAIAPDWSPGELVELDAYINSLEHIYAEYFFAHRDEGFVSDAFHELSPQMYDELVKKEADPTYEMNLLALQQQGY